MGAYILIILAIIIEVLKERSKLLRLKPFDWWGWIIIVLLLISLNITFFENRANDKKMSDLTASSNTANEQLSLLRLDSKQAKDEYANSLKAYGKRNSDQIQQTAYTMTKIFAEGVKKNEANTKYIVADAGMNKEEIKRKMDSITESQLPNITYSQELVKMIQSNDSLFLLPCFFNSGKGVAKAVYIYAYYLVGINELNWEFYKPIMQVENTEMSAGEIRCANLSSKFIPHYRFDSTNQAQVILFTGSYFNDDKRNPVKKDILFAFQWNPRTRVWGIAGGNPEDLKKIHLSASLRYFADSTLK